MLSRETLLRLSQLNLQRSTACSAVVPLVGATGAARAAAPLAVSSDLPAGVELENFWGRHWLCEQLLEALWPGGEQRIEKSRPRLARAAIDSVRMHDELRWLGRHFPQAVIYLDLETCGFAGSMIFLIGLVHYRHDRWLLSQLLARNYAEEKALLQTFWRMTAGKRLLVTFNGKSFDWPMVHDRSTLHHLGRDPRTARRPGQPAQPRPSEGPEMTRHDLRPELLHCDLLHHARRRWRNRLRDCKLQTLEQYICGRRRTADIPGREIPQAYHDFVRSGDAWPIRSILHHNALDLITLLQLSLRVVP
jgi:uncharacterized protein YprB with RNaseH-like and TPR domain